MSLRSGAILSACILASACDDGLEPTGTGGQGAGTSNGGTAGQTATAGGGSGGAPTGGSGGAPTGGSSTGGAGGAGAGGSGGGTLCDDPATCAQHAWSRALDLLQMTPLAKDAAGRRAPLVAPTSAFRRSPALGLRVAGTPSIRGGGRPHFWGVALMLTQLYGGICMELASAGKLEH